MREVPIVEYDEVALQERITEDPAEQRARAGCVCSNDVVRDAPAAVSGGGVGDEVARVDGEEFATDLERERVRGGAGEEGC